jgi:hypothetical protein
VQLPGSLQNRSSSQSLQTQSSLEQLPSMVQFALPPFVVVVVVEEVVVLHGHRSVIGSPTAFLRQVKASLAVVLASPVGSQTQACGVQA